MRKLLPTAFVMILSVFGAAVTNPSDVIAQQNAVRAVPSVDLKQYSGRWYEISRFPNKFQKKCVGNVTADYALNADGTIRVVNRCLKKDGEISEAIGKAKNKDATTNSKLEVRFAPGFLSFIPNVWGDYWIIDLDPKYQYAVIGDPKREYLWILSRTPTMDDALYQQLLRKTETMGYDPSKLIKTPQQVKTLKGEIITAK